MAYRIYKKGQNILHWHWIGYMALGVCFFGLISVFFAFPAHTMMEVLHNLLRTIQLFLPERFLIEVPEGAWYLALAKLLGAITFIMVIVQVIIQFMMTQFQVARLQYKKNHIVITGFGQCAQQCAVTALSQGKEVVAIALNPTEQQQNFVSQYKKITLLAGEPSLQSTLMQTAAHKAERVIFASSDNLLNIQGVTYLRQLLKEQPNTPQKTAHIHIHDPDFVESLKEYPHFLKEDHVLKVIHFNKPRIAARRLLLSYPLYQYADLRGQERVYVVIFGFGIQGQQMALQLARNIHYRDFKTPQIIVVDPNATQLGEEFLSRYPSFSAVCHISFINFDIHKQALNIPTEKVLSAFKIQKQVHFLQALEQQGNSAYGHNITAHILCFENDYQNITGALRLRLKSQQSRWALAPIFVSMRHSLQALSVPVDTSPYFDDIVQHFGQVEHMCTWQEIVAGSSDAQAEFLHHAYNARYGNTHSTPWSDLAETFRDANRGAADHLGVKLSSVGYWVSGDPSHWSRTVDLTVHPKAKEMMAQLEHQRWNAERLLNGWQYGAIRDDRRKIHPCLVSFEQLPENEKEKDRTNINDLQDYFTSEQPKNIINTALSTLRHQWLGQKKGAKVLPAVTIALLVTQDTPLENLISRIFKEYRNHHITLITALQTPLELAFVTQALKRLEQHTGRLLIIRSYPFDLQQDEDIEKDMIQTQLALSKQAEWVIDLMPSGQKVIGMSLKERAILRQRAVIYQIERADLIIFSGENTQWHNWRHGKTPIPAELSSLPASLQHSRKIPNKVWNINN